jgi:hypothetical protein
MAEAIDPADRTPMAVVDGIIDAHKAYKKDECIPCGAIIKMGFFFDAFGRHRDLDDPGTSRYTNICRLWEAHRHNDDERRKSMPNHFWYRFYYSGLGTPLNQDAEHSEIVSAAIKVASAVGSSAANAAKSTAQKVTGVDKLMDLKKAPAKATKKALSEAFDEMSLRPVSRAYADLVVQAGTVRGKAGRVLTMASDDRWVRRGKAAVRGTLYEVRKNPLKAAWSVAKGIVVDAGMDSIPMLRDNAAIALVFGTGLEDRLHAALRQFELAYRDATQQMDKMQRIEVSVFGADRGGVLARAFVNELVRKYKRRHDDDLAIEGNTIEIRFLGLLDAVSSVMAENKLLDFLPLTNMIKQNYGDRPLGVPQAVKRCVHFAAAHELRYYQRLDSLGKTRGDQYLYPGTSEDITGGAPAGSLGFRAELQRVALRDMLHEALMAGAALDRMEELKRYNPLAYEMFTLAHAIPVGNTTYKIPDLIKAYRTLVPRAKGLDFKSHMEVFLRWLAIRYQTPAFRESVTSHADELKHAHIQRSQEVRDAEAAYQQERRKSPVDHVALAKILTRMNAAREAQALRLPELTQALRHPVASVWDRLSEEAEKQTRRLPLQDGLRRSAERIREMQPVLERIDAMDAETSATMVEAAMMSPEAEALARAWMDGASGAKPPPPEVMALFDLLVHDTMLTSWHDHILSSTLYFQTRATDGFGKSDVEKEARQREADERAAQRVDRLPKMSGVPTARP